jgi:hypothetical protein
MPAVGRICARKSFVLGKSARQAMFFGARTPMSPQEAQGFKGKTCSFWWSVEMNSLCISLPPVG